MQGALAATEDPPAVAEALLATALAGPEPPVQVVREINLDGLDALVATGLVRQRGSRLVFEQEGIRTAALDLVVGRSELEDLHRRLADDDSKTPADAPPNLLAQAQADPGHYVRPRGQPRSAFHIRLSQRSCTPPPPLACMR